MTLRGWRSKAAELGLLEEAVRIVGELVALDGVAVIRCRAPQGVTDIAKRL